jgi:hypothetical protein
MKKNHKRVVSLYVISLDLQALTLIFSTYTTYFFENYFANELTSRLKQFKTFAVRVLSDLKILGFASNLYI